MEAGIGPHTSRRSGQTCVVEVNLSSPSLKKELISFFTFLCGAVCLEVAEVFWFSFGFLDFFRWNLTLKLHSIFF